ncbi:MAG: MFS transporter, partial [Acidobacteriaceae bacterium]|nr:MFS transporter [Acidobacteriaceae bacterium]
MPRIGSRFILVLLAAFAFVGYLLRTNISVGAELMMPDLGLTKIQMGQIFTGFLIGYALFQIPGGLLGDRIGPKRILGVCVLLWGVCTLLTGMVSRGPSNASSNSAFFWLWLIRFVLGVAEAATYPVGARLVYNWIAAPKRAFANSMMFAGTSMGAAAASPLMSWLMVRLGWPGSFAVLSIPAFLLSGVWLLFPSDKPSGCEPVEETRAERTGNGELKKILRSRRVLLLCLSYVSEGYVLFLFVFWLYIYLVEVRGFSMLKGG